MLRIDNTMLQEIGLGTLPDTEKNSLLKHIYDTLEMRVGMRLADQMTNEQLDEFERYYENKDDAGAFKWLETNFPNYKDIVQEEFDKLKAEVAQSAPQILGASQQAQANPQQQVAPEGELVNPAQQQVPTQTPPTNPVNIPQDIPNSQPPIEPPQAPLPSEEQNIVPPPPDYPSQQPPPGPASSPQ